MHLDKQANKQQVPTKSVSSHDDLNGTPDKLQIYKRILLVGFVITATLFSAMKLSTLTTAVCAVLTCTGTAASSDRVIDLDEPISGYYAQDWLKANIPYIDIPDKEIESVYYYRWSVLQRHIHYTYPGIGFVLSEFVSPQSIGYGGAFASISAAAGHQIQETRWLRNPQFGEDFIHFWNRGRGNFTQYTNWIQYAALEVAKATGNIQQLVDQLDDLVSTYKLWDEWFDDSAGLYYYHPTDDAQEYSLPGWVAGGDEGFSGPLTYRPSHNSYMLGNALAIVELAKHAKDDKLADEFQQRANKLEDAINKHLWDPEQGFYSDVIRPDNPDLKPLKGRQQVGVFPFRFGIGLEKDKIDPTVDTLFDPLGLYAPFGPTTLEQRNEYYSEFRPGDACPECCFWNGASWPFSTSHTLYAMAEMQRSGKSDTMSKDKYFEYIKIYARTQQFRGEPYVAESHYPNLDKWEVNVANRSEHYLHSVNNDLVLTGLLGLVPSLQDELTIDPIVPDNWTYFAIDKLPYHGHELTIIFDKTGHKYGKKSGLTVLSDGREIHHSDSMSTKFAIEPKRTKKLNLVNIAANPMLEGYPTIETTNDVGAQTMANDGYIFYDDVPNNRWTTNISKTENSATITFARPRKFSSVGVAIYSDIDRPGAVDCPESIEILTDKGSVKKIDNFYSQCKRNQINNFELEESVESTTVTVKTTAKKGTTVGIAEIEIWVPKNTGPDFPAVDGIVTGGKVVKADGYKYGVAVQLTNATEAVLEMGGITGTSSPKLAYSSSSDKHVQFMLNNNKLWNTTLKGTGGKFADHDLQTELPSGENFLTIKGVEGIVIGGVSV